MSIRNFDALFRPSSVAVIGASRDPAKIGNIVVRNLVRVGFPGPVLPVNPRAVAVHGVLAYPSVDALPMTPDLAVIATPAPTVPELIEALGRRGTRAVLVLSAGFAETGPEGRELQKRMLEAARPHLLRIVGPNTIGFTAPHAKLDVSFLHVAPPAGGLAFVTQSGGVVSAVVDWACGRGIGLSLAIGLGDMADVDFGDMLQWLALDPKTRAVLLHVEGLTNVRKFMSAARALARTRPVIVVKGGRSPEGARAAGSHTGALAGEAEVYAAAFERAGLLQVFDLAELFTASATLGSGTRIAGSRLAIVTNAGGLGVLAADALAEAGGELAALSPETLQRLDAILPPTWSRTNPVDVIGDADDRRYRAALEAVLADPAADAVLVLYAPSARSDPQACARAVVDVAGSGPHRLLAAWVGGATVEPARRTLAEGRVASFATPREAVCGFSYLLRHRRNQEALLRVPSTADTDERCEPERARRVLERALAEGRAWVDPTEAREVLEAYGLPMARTVRATDPEEAARAARLMGLPVALKILSPDILHKSDVGGVELGLEGEAEVRRAAERMLANVRSLKPEARIEGFVVQEMVRMPDSYELLFGARTDPLFGPVLVFGAGGIAVEALRDTAIALPPLDRELALATIRRTRIWRLLQGWRNRPGVNLDALVRAFLRFSRLVVDQDLVQEVDLNPVLANPHGIMVLDARIHVARPAVPGTARLAIEPYPRHLARLAVLRDGTPVRIRPIRPEDAPALQRMIEASDLEDLRMRFFAPLKELPAELALRLSQIDYDREMAFVVTPEDRDDEILGVGRLVADPDRTRAEFAVLVRSDLKGRGIGLRLLQELIEHAQRLGVGEIWGEVLRENRRMLDLADHFGFRRRPVSDDPAVVEVFLPLG